MTMRMFVCLMVASMLTSRVSAQTPADVAVAQKVVAIQWAQLKGKVVTKKAELDAKAKETVPLKAALEVLKKSTTEKRAAVAAVQADVNKLAAAAADVPRLKTEKDR